jgi:hypothetical protein
LRGLPHQPVHHGFVRPALPKGAGDDDRGPNKDEDEDGNQPVDFARERNPPGDRHLRAEQPDKKRDDE